MDTLKLIGEIIGVVAIVEGFFIFLSSKRERILIFKFISDALWVANQLLIGGYTGALLNGIAMGREVVFYNRDKHKWAATPLWLVVFMVITAISPMMSLISGKEGWYAILPALGSMAAVVGFYSRKPVITRYISFLANGLWLIYNVIIRNYSATVSGIILLLSATVGTVLMLIERRKLKKETLPPSTDPEQEN
ncbi:MAG: YgjV family protein [Clostridia bacterium]|nr:YgjV family protein [Clostridia bacterium]